VTIFAVENQYVINILNLCVCIFALIFRHAKRMRRIILSSVASPAVAYFEFLCVCIFAVIFRHAKRMRRIISVASPAVAYFPTSSHKRRHFFEKALTARKTGVLIFCTNFF
jgi:hypothetical protein